MQGVKDFIVELKSTLVDEIETDGGVKFYIAPEFRYEWNVSVTGKVLAVPNNNKTDIKVGDEIAFSYMVVNDKIWNDGDGSIFNLTIDGGGEYMEWTAGNGSTIKKEKHPLKKEYVGVYFNSKWDVIDSIYGKEDEIDSWLSNFTFIDTQKPVNKNLAVLDGKSLWRVKPEFVFAKKTDRGIVSYNDYVVTEPIVEDITTRWNIANNDILPSMSVLERYKDRGVVVGKMVDSEFNIGDIAAMDKRFVEKYDMWGKQYFLSKESNVLGKIIN